MANWPGHRPSGAAATTDSHQTRNTSNAQTPKSHSHSRSLSGGRALITAGELFYTTRPPDLGRGSARCRRFSIQAVVEVGHQPSVRGTRWRFIPHTRSSNASSGNRRFEHPAPDRRRHLQPDTDTAQPATQTCSPRRLFRISHVLRTRARPVGRPDAGTWLPGSLVRSF